MNPEAQSDAQRRPGGDNYAPAATDLNHQHAEDRHDAGNPEETEEPQAEGLSPTAWRNVKICLVVGGVIGNLAMRFGLVDIFDFSPPTVLSAFETSPMTSSQVSTRFSPITLALHKL